MLYQIYVILMDALSILNWKQIKSNYPKLDSIQIDWPISVWLALLNFIIIFLT